ncbi:MAG: type IV pilus assembly protein PilM [Armatimonadota bacterium]
MLSHLLANEGVVGIDIGSKSIKIARAEPGKHGARITHVAMCPTPPDCVKEGVVVNAPEVAAAIRFALRAAGIKASGGVAAIAGPGVTVRQVQLPAMPEKVLRKSIRFEAGKFISTSVEDSVIEFDILGPAGDGQMNLLLVAAPNSMVDSKVAVLEQAGLEPLAVDIEVFAMLRVLAGGRPVDEGTLALLDIGASHTEINLVSRGELALTRTIPIAGDSLTSAIRGARGCSEEEAEQVKHGLDLSEMVSAPPGQVGGPDERAVQSLIDELLREIRRSINYYQSQLPEGAKDLFVDRMVLAGGTTRLAGLAPYVKSRLSIEVEQGHPTPEILGLVASDSGIGEADVPLLMTALGLAAKESQGALRSAVA